MSRGGSIKRDDSGRWCFIVDIAPAGAPRRQVRRRGFRTKAAAQTALTELLADAGRGTFVEPAKVTVADYLDGWLAGLEVEGLRASTLASYADNLRLHVLPHLGAGRLQHLAAVDLDRCYAHRLREGRRNGTGGLSPRSVRYVHTIVRSTLADAARKGLVVRNVADQATPPSPKASRAREMATWTPAELRAFLEHVSDHHLAAMWRLAAMSGMRRGELLGLRWADVDFDAGRVAVRQQVVSVRYELALTDVKTDHGRRTIDLDDETVASLRAHRARQAEHRLAIGGYHDHGLVFPGLEGDPQHPDAVSKMFDRLVRSSGLPRIRLHDLRHGHASHLIAAGVHPKVVSERLGHAS